MKDNTVTIHPTVRTSTVYALELIAEDNGVSLGKALEKCLEKCDLFQEKKKIYKS